MAFLKTANAAIVQPGITFRGWDEIHPPVENPFGKRVASKVVLEKFDPKQYLLSHATIVASVDTENSSDPLGKHMVDGFQINRKFSDYLITPNTAKFVNNNYDGWERKLLLSCYKSFTGAHNYLEHVQIPEMSKGRIIDAAARDIGDSVYIDILVATDRKHKALIDAIHSGKLGTLSMGCSVSSCTCSKCGNVASDETEMCTHIKYFKGNDYIDANGTKRKIAELCFTPGTRVVLSDGSRRPIESLQVGDMVLSHTGAEREITEVYTRKYTGQLMELGIEGLPQPLSVTPKHPFWVLSVNDTCACGCGGKQARPKTFDKIKFSRRYLPGHNPRVETLTPPEFGFKEAQLILPGDVLAMPIPTKVIRPKNADVKRTELLGWFLAEGNYIKHRGVRIGVSFTLNADDEQHVAQRLAKLLEECFEPELQDRPLPKKRASHAKECGTDKILTLLQQPMLTRDLANMLPEYRGIAGILNRYANLGMVASRPLSQGERLDIVGRARSRARVWVATGVNPKSQKTIRYDQTSEHTYNAAVTERLRNGARCYPNVYTYPRAEGGFKLVVKYVNREASKWFFHYAGEYSDSKVLAKEILYWPLDLQSTLLKHYVRGDGSVDSLARHHASSVSETLISQLQLIAARCGLWTRRQVVFEGRTTHLDQVVGADPIPVGSDGCKPRHEIYFQPSDTTTSFFGFDVEHARHIGPKWRTYRGYMLYPVRSVERHSYNGLVHNLSVEEDESYLVEGLATHNCGHHTDPDSVKFIEASWVANPAFKGAVLRNVLTPTEAASYGKKVMVAFNTEPAAPDSTAMLKAARTAQQAPVPAPNTPPQTQESESESKEPPIDPMSEAVDSLAEDIRNKAVNKVRQEMRGPAPTSIDENRNETLIHAAAFDRKVLASAMQSSEWRKIATIVLKETRGDLNAARRILLAMVLLKAEDPRLFKQSSLQGQDILAASRLFDKAGGKPVSAGEQRIYRTVIQTGGPAAYPNEHQYLKACQGVFGRALTDSEKTALIKKGRLFRLATKPSI